MGISLKEPHRTGAQPLDRAAIVSIIRQLGRRLKAAGVAQVSLFGSVLHGGAGPDSDVDLLLDLADGAQLSLLDRLVLRDMIADAIGRSVDLIPRKALIEDIRAEVEREAVPILPSSYSTPAGN